MIAIQEDGAFTVRVRMLNHLKQDECAWAESELATGIFAGPTCREFQIPYFHLLVSLNNYAALTVNIICIELTTPMLMSLGAEKS